jgi:uncharacterized membrane protein YcjF (UPF0283 family)
VPLIPATSVWHECSTACSPARLGLAAIDVTRPLPFTALRRPALADLAKDLLRKRDGEE